MSTHFPISAGDDYRNHAWRYFELHAKQRMAIFNFFLVLSGFIATGLVASVQVTGLTVLVGAFLGALLSLVSFIFWKLDQRVSFLIKNAENVLIELESALSEPSIGLFSNEVAQTTNATSSGSLWSRHWTYGSCFRTMFRTMGGVGFLGSCWSVAKFAGWIPWPVVCE